MAECMQVEVPEWYVPGAVRAASPDTPRVTTAAPASPAATQEVAAAFDIIHGQLLSYLLAFWSVFTAYIIGLALSSVS